MLAVIARIDDQRGRLTGLVNNAAWAVAAEGIRVNAVWPSIIDTAINAASGDRDRPSKASALIALGRLGTADQLAAAMVRLLSDEASHTTGMILAVGSGAGRGCRHP